MRILAIDPGTDHSGVVLYDADAHEVLWRHDAYDNDELALWIRACRAGRSTDSLQFTFLAIEDIESYGMAVGKSTFITCKWIGRFIEAWSGEPPLRRVAHLIPRRDVKLNLCGGATYRDPMAGTLRKVGDKEIKGALRDRFPATGGGKNPVVGIKSKPGPLYGIKSHAWSALAIAITYVDTEARRHEQLATGGT